MPTKEGSLEGQKFLQHSCIYSPDGGTIFITVIVYHLDLDCMEHKVILGLRETNMTFRVRNVKFERLNRLVVKYQKYIKLCLLNYLSLLVKDFSFFYRFVTKSRNAS